MIDGRRNSLNALRLFFAVTVIASHALSMGGFADSHIGGRTTPGTIAVFCFFGISGYLIAQSAEKNRVGRYLWQRFLRIFPAFWLCLALLVVFFGSIGWEKYGLHPHGCGITCYLQNRGIPFFFQNIYLRSHNGWLSVIPGTRSFGWAGVEDGSLWTLFYEFLCYLLLAGLAVVGLLRRRSAVLAITVTWWVGEILFCIYHPTTEFDAESLMFLVPIFLTGALIYLYRDKVPDSGWLALGGVGVFVLGFFIPVGNAGPPNNVEIASPALAYTALWLGAHLPLQKIGAKNDYSYGMYLYGFPVSALLTSTWNVHSWTYPGFLLASVVVTGAFAAVSWWAVERPALKLKKVGIPRLRPLPVSSPEPSAVA